uniref:Hemolysin III n=1 Tax=Arcella intermedia TaxID=1963864 RepID=A0A6B2LHY9_9EUKA
MNSITHGFGVFLSLVGGFTLAHDAQGYPRRHQWGIGIYVFSLVALFMSSTLCHSFTFMKKTGMIFQIFDHAAIYLLIAGTYTPLCFVNLSSSSWTGTILASILWSLALIGMTGSFFQAELKFELVLYVTMGWLAVFTGYEIVESLPPEALMLLVLGGLAYTGGIYFFIIGIKKPSHHVIWHIFVIIGATFHFFAIREAIFHKGPLHWN